MGAETVRGRALLPAAMVLGLWATCGAAAAPTGRGAFGRLEASFELPGLAGNPFDYTQNDVRVLLRCPLGRRLSLPAFFDGGSLWRVRHTPDVPGTYVLERITLNGRPVEPRALDRRRFSVSGRPGPGFVRRVTGAELRFVFDDGQPYYPIGCNVGWASRTLDVPGHLYRLGQAGANWSRIWMCHWDGKNLDWVQERPVPVGELSLEVARRWDGIVEAAERAGIRFQMVLQHHGQLSSHTDSNWAQHPWNQANGGWLPSAESFFTDERALALTRAKYRYIIARWGYSPSIMAWELFNEVQFVDAMRTQRDAVARWHTDMAAFLRSQDPFRHLVTTSSDLDLGVWHDMDYYQPHVYPPDAATAIASIDARRMDKPIFIGEIGPGGGADLARDDGRFLHQALWASLMSGMAGAAQYWAWDTVERNNLYAHFRAAAGFVRESWMAHRSNLRPAAAAIETDARGTLRFAPPGGWGLGRVSEVTVQRDGTVRGLAGMQSYLHGAAHRQFPSRFTFHVDYPAPGTFTVRIGTVARSGAHLKLSVDGVTAAEHAFAPAERDRPGEVALEARVPAGRRAVSLENVGSDWVAITSIELSPYVPALGVLGRTSRSHAVLWVYARPGSSEPLTGTVLVPGLAAGQYRVTWWDTYEARRLSQTRAVVEAGRPLRLTSPALARDAAVWVEPVARGTTASAPARRRSGP